MASIFGAIISIFNAIPSLRNWYEEFLVAYAAWAKEKKDENFRKALDRAVATFDQRELEAPGISGEPSGKKDVEITK